ncbi:MAG TPA: amidohydrolase family protein [Myxococcota bacterium]|nr:amidohydrolase family protein [Myxococcota bacterium]
MTAGRIDTHHHIVPPSYVDWLARLGIDAGAGVPFPRWSREETLEMMDRRGIETAIVSLSTPGVHFGDAAEARKRAREINELSAGLVRSAPARFGFFAFLPLPDVDGALAELEYAFDSLGADGVVMLANARGVYLGDPALDAVFDALERRRAVVFVHPSIPPGLAPVEGVPGYAADFLLDTTRAAVRLAGSGTLDRCPNLKIILSHAGGFVPYAAYRMGLAASPRRDLADGVAQLRKFWFDTALSGSPTALPSLLAFARPGRVLYGSDWPFASEPIIAGFNGMYESFPVDAAQRASIDRGAAETLFPRLARA